MAMMAMTTRSSMSVNPVGRRRGCRDISSHIGRDRGVNPYTGVSKAIGVPMDQNSLIPCFVRDGVPWNGGFVTIVDNGAPSTAPGLSPSQQCLQTAGRAPGYRALRRKVPLLFRPAGHQT